MNKLEEILFLKNIRGVGKAKIYKTYWGFLQLCTDIEDLKTAVSDHGVSQDNIEKAWHKTETDMEKLESMQDTSVITVFDEAYPQKLNVMREKRPLILYVKGNRNILNLPNVAIIGTRKPSEWSQKVEHQLVKKILSISDRIIVSGLALGCDRIAHETTVLDRSRTIAVLPSGVNVITPASHRKLAEDILKNDGCLISEYEPDAKAYKTTYVERDAVVAALSDIVFVVECAVKSGTMHTAEYARKYGRLLGCYDPADSSKGNYGGNAYMINEKNAMPVSDTDELTELLNRA